MRPTRWSVWERRMIEALASLPVGLSLRSQSLFVSWWLHLSQVTAICLHVLQGATRCRLVRVIHLFNHTLCGMRPTPPVSHCQSALFTICSALWSTSPCSFHSFWKRRRSYSQPPSLSKQHFSNVSHPECNGLLSNQGSPFKIKALLLKLTFLLKIIKL